MLKPNSKQNSGFTLIETFVAITILLIAVLIPLGVMSKAIEDGLFIKNKVIAYYLAQEGMELVINQVSSNIKKPTNESPYWLDYLGSCIGGGVCTILSDIDSDEIIIQPCSGSEAEDCPYLRQQSESGYDYDSPHPPSIFKRAIEVGQPITLSGNREMAVPVKVTIYWKNKASEQELVLDDYVFNSSYVIQ